MQSLRWLHCSLLLWAALALCGTPGVVAAHAVVKKASLSETPVKPGAPATVTLDFNASVEPALSKVLLLKAKDEPLALLIGPGPKPNELVLHLPALPPGEYSLRYQVYADDGHLTEGYLRFRVEEDR
jgi:methionine-rich copper-binding protein CopC